MSRATSDGQPPHPEYSGADSPAPQPVNLATGQHRAYWVLSEEERAAGFVRPVRHSYLHVGVRPQHPTRELTPEEQERYAGEGYALFEQYPATMSPRVGRFWTVAQLRGGCGVETVLGRSIAETYARDPSFYGSTYCVGCQAHRPVQEFVWCGSNELVGS